MPADNEYTHSGLRLPGHDYSTDGCYFVTICTDQKIFHFGAIFNDQMILNEIGLIVKNEWFKLADRFKNIHLGPFCVMPNHIHCIIQINSFAASSQASSSASPSPSPSPSFLLNKNFSVGAGLAPAHADNTINADNADNTDNAVNADNAHNADHADHAGYAGYVTQSHNANQAEYTLKSISGLRVGASPGLRVGASPGIRAGASPGIRAGASPAPTDTEINRSKKEEEIEEEGKSAKGKVTLGNIIGAYKSLVMKECLKNHQAKFPEGSIMPLFGKIWQRNYYEHIIRAQYSYDQIALYIVKNPQNWTRDKFYINIG